MADKIKVSGPVVVAFAEKHGVDLADVTGTGPDGRITIDDVRNAREMPYVTPFVARVANEEGVDLRDVKGTGIDGRIRKSDVLAAAGKLPDHDLLPPRVAAPTSTDAWRDAAARGPAFALNPLVDRIRAQATTTAAAAPTGTAPTLFANGGDLPSFTASGIAPETLLTVPWEARHAMAAASTPAEAYAIQADCAQYGSALEYAEHPGNDGYRSRVTKWQASAPLTDEQWDALDPGMADLIARGEAEIARHQAAAEQSMKLRWNR